MPDITDLPVRRIRRYGWRRSHPDMRDFRFAPRPQVIENLPPKFSLRSKDPDPYDQLAIGSCTANGIAYAVQFERRKQNLTPDFTPSRLFIYYGERVIEGTVDVDAGAEIRDGFKVIGSVGAPPESDWPYDIDRFDQQPPDQAFTDGKLDVALKYMAVPQDLTAIKSSIYEGCPVVFGFTVYDSFESQEVARTGMLPMPQPDEQALGGHCVAWVGWDDENQLFETRNSWGANWGDGGYFWFPYAYGLDPNLTSDLWCVQSVGTAQ